MATVQIEIPDEVLLLNGVRYEPTGEYRKPREGDVYLSSLRGACVASFTFVQERYLILRPVWTWPDWLGGAAIAVNDNGRVCWHEKEPMKNKTGHWVSSGHIFSLDFLLSICHFTPPALKPGEIVHNPRYEAKQ